MIRLMHITRLGILTASKHSAPPIKYLLNYESKVDIYRTDYEKAKREYEDFCKANGFAEVLIDEVSGNDA